MNGPAVGTSDSNPHTHRTVRLKLSEQTQGDPEFAVALQKALTLDLGS